MTDILYEKQGSYLQGKEEGRAETRGEEKAIIARNLLKMKMSVKDISTATGLSEAEVLELQKEMQ
ncbi:conserved hypothetical protein (putative transposase or invertase) [Fibrobacter sp. UWH9]|uniref:hypothetical protein n=1 Tax=Fibrobacter sp. UWH9 TaxID=1896213 RepID=UPI00090EFCEF|nr:hypothetical protein [Fibrobacter sp. UWH9]SHH93489.1 conserved hypothetical protein (putative transposase or invertase) [Fibrobacter sp. UWH9]